jgi:hydrogenase nickel incorporation protein HypA/HybF
MHELSLAQALVDEVERIKAKENAVEVLSVTVSIGALSGVDRESFEFAFPLVAEGTGLAGAALVIQETPAEIQCEDCGKATEPDLAFFKCRACGSSRVTITGGRDFLIQAVQVRCEDDNEEPDGDERSGKGESCDV